MIDVWINRHRENVGRTQRAALVLHLLHRDTTIRFNHQPTEYSSTFLPINFGLISVAIVKLIFLAIHKHMINLPIHI